MAVRKILIFPEPALAEVSARISRSDSGLDALIQDLTDTLYEGPGVGLAAPQIGELKQVSVIDVRHRKLRGGESHPPNHGFIVLINPALISGAGEQIPREGCLSVPDLLANVRRYREVVVRTQLREGGERVIKASGFEALALQHEIDHLAGRLFLDRVADVRTDVFRRRNG